MTINITMKRTTACLPIPVYVFVFIAMLISNSAIGQKTGNQRPNFIIIFSDDLGYGDIGCYGSPHIRTPNIDRMAGEGARFTSFYAATFCAPSRAQLLTASYPPRVSFARNPSPNSPYGLHPDEITIAEVLKAKSYTTKCIGKWHLGDAPEFLPTKQGFDSFFGTPYSNDMWKYHPKMPPRADEDSLMTATRKRAAYTGFAGEGSYYPANGGFPNDLPLMQNEKVIEHNPDQRKLIPRYTDAALKFIEEQKDKPFFLYLAHNMPHVPLFVSEKFAGRSLRGLYGDAVMEIDWSVGQILDKLKQLNLDEKTMVIFMSDNGPWLQYGIDGGSAGPLRAGKGTVYEGGMRVPAIFRWPKKIPAGTISDAVSANLDLLPTIAELAGGKVPSDRTIDGRSLWPVLTGKNANSPHEYFHYMGGSAEGEANYLGIRDDRWKLLFNIGENGKVNGLELYDLLSDVSEKFNRLEKHPEIVSRLTQSAQTFYDDLLKDMRPAGKRK